MYKYDIPNLTTTFLKAAEKYVQMLERTLYKINNPMVTNCHAGARVCESVYMLVATNYVVKPHRSSENPILGTARVDGRDRARVVLPVKNKQCRFTIIIFIYTTRLRTAISETEEKQPY